MRVARLASCALIGLALVVTSAVSVGTASAQTRYSYDDVPYVVKNDRGGLLRDRLRQIVQLRKQSRPVQIKGRQCFSTCTMLLGLPNTCVSPDTMFGFHGPSSYGKRLDATAFEYASEVIASYYPEPLHDWYMSEARYTIRGLHRVRGENIIKLGIASC